MEEGAALAARRLPPAAYRPVLTNFYPLYDGANDQVDPVTSVRRVFFQRVIPRYRLSTSETRDEGLGPDFVYAPTRNATRRPRPPEAVAASEGGSASSDSRAGRAPRSSLYRLDLEPPKPPEPWLGRRANLYA